MPMKCAVMKHLDLMIGVDVHEIWPPGEPAPTGVAPFVTIMPMCGTFLTAEMSPTALTLSQQTMKRGTDIGPLIPHIGPPSLLTPLDILMSGSASYFGPASVCVEGTPVAAAVLFVIGINQNCNFIGPLPTGRVLCFTTHYVGMTLLDMLYGVFTATLAFAIDTATGAVTTAAAKQVQKRIIQPLSKKVAAKVASKTAAKTAANAAPTPSAAKWQSALPSKTPAQAGGLPSSISVPGGPPLKTAAKPLAGGHRPPAAKPGGWQSATPSNPAAKPTMTMGGHKPTAKLPPAAKTAANAAKAVKQTMQQKIEDKLGSLTEFSIGYLVQTPFGMINDATLWLLSTTGVEEFGGGEKRESQAKPKKEADKKGDDKKDDDGKLWPW